MELGNTTNHKIYRSIDILNDTVYERVWDGQFDIELLGDLWEMIYPSVSDSTRLTLNLETHDDW